MNEDKEKYAIYLLKMASRQSLQYYQKPLICTYSGGKDSEVLLEMFKRAGIPFEVINNHTTVDAPQTVYHIRNKFRELEEKGIKCTIHYPVYKGQPCTMWTLIPQKGFPPIRTKRYCCKVLKEESTKNRYIATGVRWAESNARKKRREIESITARKEDSVRTTAEIMLSNDNEESRKLFEQCRLKGEMTVNPIIDWEDRDIWDFIRSEKIEYNPLYDMGYVRVGCVGCPMAGKRRWKEFADFPTYKDAYIRAFEKMLKIMNEKEKRYENSKWKTGEDVFLWWMEDKNVAGQMNFEDFPEIMPE